MKTVNTKTNDLHNAVKTNDLQDFVNLLLEKAHKAELDSKKKKKGITWTYNPDQFDYCNLFHDGWVGHDCGFKFLSEEEKATVALYALLNPEEMRFKLVKAKKHWATDTTVGTKNLAIFFMTKQENNKVLGFYYNPIQLKNSGDLCLPVRYYKAYTEYTYDANNVRHLLAKKNIDFVEVIGQKPSRPSRR